MTFVILQSHSFPQWRARVAVEQYFSDGPGSVLCRDQRNVEMGRADARNVECGLSSREREVMLEK